MCLNGCPMRQSGYFAYVAIQAGTGAGQHDEAKRCAAGRCHCSHWRPSGRRPVAQTRAAMVSKALRFERIRPDSDQSEWDDGQKRPLERRPPSARTDGRNRLPFAPGPRGLLRRRSGRHRCLDGALTPAGEAQAQGAVRSVHNDWQIRCDTPPGAQGEQCALIQSVTAEDRPNIGLTVIILKTADKKTRLMRVIAPPGVLLPSGLGLKIDNAEVGRAGFVRCVPNGCVAEVIMDDNLIGKLRTGQIRHLHHLPDAGRRHRLPDQPEGFRRGLRQAALITRRRSSPANGSSLGQRRCLLRRAPVIAALAT